MIVGVPKGVKDSEHRVALTPEGARELTLARHRFLIHDHAGDGSNILGPVAEAHGMDWSEVASVIPGTGEP